jgi:hypothetical protein
VKPSNGNGQRSNTTPKQPGGITGKGFVKGDPRINRNGRPKTFDELRKLAQDIAHEQLSNGMTRADAILRMWSGSKEPSLQKAFMEYGFGKVPDKLEGVTFPQQTLVLHYDHESKSNGANGTRIPPAVPSGADRDSAE